MRSDVIKVYKSLHTWTGLCAGMALFICFFAGALTMFEAPLDRWASSDDDQMPWIEVSQRDDLIQSVLKAYPESAEKSELILHLEPDANVAAPLTWEMENPNHDVVRWRATLGEKGDLIAEPYQPSEMAHLIDVLHQTAGIPGGAGHDLLGVYVMGVISVLYLLAIVSGLIILLPTLIKDFFALRLGKNLKRFWLDAHNVVGITSLPFHFIIAVTVVVFAFHDIIYGSLKVVVYGEQPLFPPRSLTADAPKHDLKNLASIDQVLASVQDIEPDFRVRELAFRRLTGPGAVIFVSGEADFQMQRSPNMSHVMVNPFTASVVDTSVMPEHQDVWSSIVTSFFGLHFGNFGGSMVRWLYFGLGIGGAFLFYSGNILWVETRRRKQRRAVVPPEQKRNTRWMAAATVGVCWGCVAGVAASMLVGKLAGEWLMGDMSSWGLTTTDLYMMVYYSVFVASVVYAFWRGAARAVVSLLRLCAALVLGIPVTGWLLLPWPESRPDLFAVEWTALAMGLVLLVMAKRTARRVANGHEDSVWSSRPIEKQRVEGSAGTAL